MHDNLSVDRDATARIQSGDPDYFGAFDTYSAGVREFPTALLLDRKDRHYLPSKYWGPPLSHEEIHYAIDRLEEQYRDSSWNLPLEPRALRVTNRNGEILGFVYTSLVSVAMKTREDGGVEVFLPDARPVEF